MMDRYGFSILLGWAASSLMLRLGGVRAHRGLRPAAFGLISGNAVAPIAWSLYGLYRPMDGVWVIE